MTDTVNDSITRLEQIVRDRLATGTAQASYVASLAAKGQSHVARKMGEEAIELIVAAAEGQKGEMVTEAADLVFHLTVLLATAGLGWDAIAAELDRRHGTSGHDEKAARQP